MTTNARQFVDEIADALRAKGREVQLTETEESFGTFVWLYSPAPKWYDRDISLDARQSNLTKRWKLGRLRVGSSTHCKAFECKTRTAIRIAADVYA